MEDMCSFKVNDPSVIYETMENEVILINLDKGYYYCLQELAADIWALILSNATIDQMIALTAKHFSTTDEQTRAVLTTFIDQLTSEQLIRADKQHLEKKAPAVTFHAKSFTTPKLQKFEDMQNLLFLDPIHEVDEQGWPHESETV